MENALKDLRCLSFLDWVLTGLVILQKPLDFPQSGLSFM